MTGAEAIQQIFETIKRLETEIADMKTSVKLIEGNIKVLNNRAAGLMLGIKSQLSQEKIEPAIQEQSKIMDSPIAILPSEKPQSNRGSKKTAESAKQPQIKQPPLNEEPGMMTYKKVHGRLVDGDEQPIEGVLIKIYDKNNEVCATTESDAVGYWESMVKVGKYSAEYVKENFKTQNKTFEVTRQSKETMVM